MTIQLTSQQIAENVDALVLVGRCESNTESMIRNDYTEHCNGNAAAGGAIVAFWTAAEAAGVLAKVRSQLSRASKAVHKDIEGMNEKQGATVKDGQLVLAVMRNKASKSNDSALVSLVKGWEQVEGRTETDIAKMTSEIARLMGV